MSNSVMTGPIAIESARMRLVALTAELAALQVSDRERFFDALGVEFEASWPPELATPESLEDMSAALAANPADAGWYQWVYISPVMNRLVGMGGFKGGPGADGEVEIGYSMLSSFREQGLATEGVEALLEWAYGHDGVRQVVAFTQTERIAAQRVLEKAGFLADDAHAPGEPGDDVICYRHRPARAAA